MTILFLLTTYIYCHNIQNLNGPWILDDKGTISMNPILTNSSITFSSILWNSSSSSSSSSSNNNNPVWTKDFWGVHTLTDAQSHKSWRPFCTISYILTRDLLTNGKVESDDDTSDVTFWFHLVDRLLNALVTSIVYPIYKYTLLHYSKIMKIKDIRKKNDMFGKINTQQEQVRVIHPFIIAILFAVHPIHVEAVANTTGRAEVLCALFYFIAFLVYARFGVGLCCWEDDDIIVVEQKQLQHSSKGNNSTLMGSLMGVCFMLLFTTASMLSKEHGVTAPLICIIWDALIATNTSIPELWTICLYRDNRSSTKSCVKNEANASSSSSDENTDSTTERNTILQKRKKQCFLFLIRIILSIIGFLIICNWRISKNGDSKPDFVCEQNPAACEPNRLYRFFHYSYLWSFNFWLMLYPSWLSPDWSGGSIPVMNEYWATDPRFGVVLLTWFVIIAVILQSIYVAFTPVGGTDSSDLSHMAIELRRRTILTGFYWMFIPFLLSSNLLVYVGFVVADRTLYLPSMGFCHLLLEALSNAPFFISKNHAIQKRKTKSRGFKSSIIMPCCTIFLLIMYTWKQQTQTKLWSHPVLIWGEAYRLNPNSIISGTGTFDLL